MSRSIIMNTCVLLVACAIVAPLFALSGTIDIATIVVLSTVALANFFVNLWGAKKERDGSIMVLAILAIAVILLFTGVFSCAKISAAGVVTNVTNLFFYVVFVIAPQFFLGFGRHKLLG